MVYLLDVDGTICAPNSDVLFEGVADEVNRIYSQGHHVWLFTCRPSNPIWINALVKQGLRFDGIIQKPFAEDGYVLVDDKLIDARKKLL